MRGALTRADLERAKRVLDRFTWVGVLEEIKRAPKQAIRSLWTALEVGSDANDHIELSLLDPSYLAPANVRQKSMGRRCRTSNAACELEGHPLELAQLRAWNTLDEELWKHAKDLMLAQLPSKTLRENYKKYIFFCFFSGKVDVMTHQHH
jgi:hypothetical protein